MENQVLAHFSFQIYTPTPKTFLRRFLRAAQASYLVMHFCNSLIYLFLLQTVLERLRIYHCFDCSLQRPRLELECLASYLTELTLIDYHFLKFLPSVIAASAVFLAKWTLDQSNHPWVCHVASLTVQFNKSWIFNFFLFFFSLMQNLTLEHYTTYKASDLKASVHALQDLQLNTRGCPLSAIRMKYRQEKVSLNRILNPVWFSILIRLFLDLQFKSVAVLISPKLLDTLF